ncbi:hypothetical protein PR048_010796 [Dryococelus australis]|uniref:Reverse transcriptase domain-containing protein n=1 Tax=Dryococelus australis TaxID=614101 RepID=A0ABQ9I4S4_9NEOP|nr:hypothetical protein PR048_010796 [Dryococelus australis]
MGALRGATTIKRSTDSRQEMTESTSGASRGDRLLTLLEDLEEVQDESWRPDTLEVAVRSSMDGGSPSEGIDWWLRSTCKVKDERRHDYAIVQNLWKRDHARVARCILKGEKIDGVIHLPPETAGWWAKLFSRGEGLGDLEVPEDDDEDPHGMSIPITSEEEERSEISGQSAPGPNGIMVQQWRKIPTGLKVVLFNLFLLTDDFPDLLLQARTVLLPKIDMPSLPSDIRPISISSVIMRHYHKILAQRIQNCIKIGSEQRAFQSADGLAENLSLLSEVLHSATSQLRSMYMAIIDVKKAFDTIYARGTTSIQLPGQVLNDIPVHQGVRQGDPLSPVLFNVVMIQLGNDTISYLAFADDLDGQKSHSLALVAVGKTGKIKVLDEPTLRLGNQLLSPLGITECWRYLGIFFTSLIHQLSFARVSMDILKAMDVVVRASVRRWLKLPRDVALGIFYAPPSSSGLGVPSFLRSVPVWILSRLRNMSKSPPARSLVDCPFFSRRVEWAERAATVKGTVLDTTLKVRNYWSARLLASVDGKDLIPAKASKLSTTWLVADARVVPAQDYISYLQIISNSLPTKLRTSRGRQAEGILPKCWAGCDDARITRHDNIIWVVADKCVKRDWEVTREPRYRTEAGLVAVNKDIGKAVIIDVQVVQASNLDWSYNTEIKKYATKDLLAAVMAERGVQEVSVVPVTLTWKGSWFAKSASELQDIIGGDAFLRSLVTRTLFGTPLC